MKVKELIEKLNKLPQDMVIKPFEPICDLVETNETKDFDINCNNFLYDIGMMCDFIKMDRFEFLQKYFYVTSLQYDITKDLFYADRYKYLQEYYDKMIELDTTKALWQTQILEYEIQQIQNKKRGVK